MKIRNKRLRDLASFVFTIYYLFVAEQADEKVRKIRAVLTVDHMRIAWNKPTRHNRPVPAAGIAGAGSLRAGNKEKRRESRLG